MLSGEIVPYDTLPKFFLSPACRLSETLWLKFLLHLTQNQKRARAFPTPQNYTFFDHKKHIAMHGVGVRKKILGNDEFGEKTILCLTGPLAGAVCLALRSNHVYEDRWSINPSIINADAVPLRMIQRDFEMIVPFKNSLMVSYGFEVRDEVGTGWFSEVLISLLADLDWEHNAAQIEANAVEASEVT